MGLLVAFQVKREPPASAPEVAVAFDKGVIDTKPKPLPMTAPIPVFPAIAEDTESRPSEPSKPEPELGFYPSASIPDILAFLRQESGPELVAHAWELWGMPDSDMKRIGALLLSRLGLLTGEHLDKLDDLLGLEQSLDFLGWLQVLGGQGDADQWITWLNSSADPNAVRDMLESGVLFGAAARAGLTLTHSLMDPLEAGPLWRTLAADEGLDYDLRMKALMLARSSLPADAFREELNLLGRQARDADWAAGIQRYSDSIRAPDVLMNAPPVIGPHSIDLAVADSYPTMLQDLVIELEAAVEIEASRILPDTGSRLLQVVGEMKRLPTLEVDQLSLARLSNMVSILNRLEMERSVTPSPVDYPAGTLLPEPLRGGPPTGDPGFPPESSHNTPRLGEGF